MKRIIVIVSLLIIAGTISAQQFPTNSISQTEAIQMASQPATGMSENRVIILVEKKNGLKTGGNIGNSTGWTRVYLLSNGCFLDLQMDPKEVRTDGKWGGNGLLKSASIRSNGVEIILIKLKNSI